jgi:hypothetical protein
MRSLSCNEVVTLWERGMDLSPWDKGALALSLVEPTLSPENVLSLSLGDYQSLLADLYAQMFGEEIEAVFECESCSELMELSFSLQEVVPRGIQSGCISSTLKTSFGTELLYHPLRVSDFAKASHLAEESEALECLVGGCLLDARREGKSVVASSLKDEEIEQLAHAIEKLDPLAQPSIEIACASCGKVQTHPFSISDFFWDKVAEKARRLVMQVNLLAQAYGWSEEQILALSERRRGLYMELLEG